MVNPRDIAEEEDYGNIFLTCWLEEYGHFRTFAYDLTLIIQADRKIMFDVIWFSSAI